MRSAISATASTMRPALHAADVGISVEQAVDVARESADIILLKPDLDVLRRGVEDGRRTFANTLKYICITTSANFGNMVSMALAAPLLPFLPLAAKQILLNNFLSDVPSIAISTDNVDPETVTRAQRWQIKDVQRFMIVFGLISSVFDLLTFAILLLVFHANEATFQTTWFVISLLTELAVVLVLERTGRRSAAGRAACCCGPPSGWAHRRPCHPVPRAVSLGVRFCAAVGARDGGGVGHRRWLHRSDGRGRLVLIAERNDFCVATCSHNRPTSSLPACGDTFQSPAV